MQTSREGNKSVNLHTYKCETTSCSNQIRKRRHCSTCRWRSALDNNPVKVLFSSLKSHAKQRGIEFSLSLAHYEEIVTAADYVRLRGNRAEDLTIDRILPELGYADDNIQVLTNRANIRKRFTDQEIWRPQRFSTYEEAKRINGTPF